MSKLPRFISTSSDLGRWRKDPRADPTRSRPPAPQKPATRRRRVGSSASRRSRPTGSPPRSSPSHDRKVVSWDRRRSARVGTRTALDRKSVPFNHWSARTVAPPFPGATKEVSPPNAPANIDHRLFGCPLRHGYLVPNQGAGALGQLRCCESRKCYRGRAVGRRAGAADQDRGGGNTDCRQLLIGAFSAGPSRGRRRGHGGTLTPIRVFISSVQRKFARERGEMHDDLRHA